jgi:hypothetical protein
MHAEVRLAPDLEVPDVRQALAVNLVRVRVALRERVRELTESLFAALVTFPWVR